MPMVIFKKALTKLINKAFWQEEKKPSSSLMPPPFPVITISRETGSGGKLIAQMVAKKLKMKFYDKELVEMIAKNAKRRKEIVETLDEKSRSAIEGIIVSLSSSEKKLSETAYLKHLSKVILTIAQKGKAVILGRGANFIIPKQNCLNVRIIAPLKQRIANTVKFEKMSPQQAKENIYRIHMERKNFVKRYFQKNISNANYYDLVINTQNLTLQQATNIIVKAFKEKFSHLKI